MTVQPEAVIAHFVIVGGTQMECVQPNCDGVHHYYVACER